jgi:HK97 gp10 family phage protein
MSEVSKLAADLGTAGAKADRASTVSMLKVAEQLRSDIATDAPVLTGETRASVNMKASGSEARITASSAAFYLEFGTSKMAPQPFMFDKLPPASERLAKLLAAITPI